MLSSDIIQVLFQQTIHQLTFFYCDQKELFNLMKTGNSLIINESAKVAMIIIFI